MLMRHHSQYTIKSAHHLLSKHLPAYLTLFYTVIILQSGSSRLLKYIFYHMTTLVSNIIYTIWIFVCVCNMCTVPHNITYFACISASCRLYMSSIMAELILEYTVVLSVFFFFCFLTTRSLILTFKGLSVVSNVLRTSPYYTYFLACMIVA